MRIRITSDGGPITHVVDAETGKPVEGLQVLQVIIEAGRPPVVYARLIHVEYDIIGQAAFAAKGDKTDG